MDRKEIFLRIVKGAPPFALTVPELSAEEWAACQPLFADGSLVLNRIDGGTYVSAVSYASAAEALREAGEIDTSAEAIAKLGEREGRDAFENAVPFDEGWPESVRVGWKHASMISMLHPSAAS